MKLLRPTITYIQAKHKNLLKQASTLQQNDQYKLIWFF
jgi:hypothetical protein